MGWSNQQTSAWLLLYLKAAELACMYLIFITNISRYNQLFFNRAGISMALCNQWNAQFCRTHLENIFIYLFAKADGTGGECGLIGGNYCAQGDRYVAGPGKEYFAFCVKRV